MIKLSQYHDDMLKMLESSATSKFIINYFADILDFKALTFDDCLYILDNYLAYCYDVTSNEKDKRKYNNLDNTVRNSIIKYHKYNAYLDTIYNMIDKLDELSIDNNHKSIEIELQELHNKVSDIQHLIDNLSM